MQEWQECSGFEVNYREMIEGQDGSFTVGSR